MASIISHAAAGAALSIALAPDRASTRFWPVAIAVAVLPDADSLLYYYRTFYYYSIGHRGFFHSPFFGLIVCFLVMALFFREEAFSSGRWFCYCFIFFLIWLSHGFLDALTNGGRGVAFLAPFSSERFFLPWTPIQVSPMNVTSFFGPWGWSVLKSEFVWIWLPSIAIIILSKGVRLRGKVSGVEKQLVDSCQKETHGSMK